MFQRPWKVQELNASSQPNRVKTTCVNRKEARDTRLPAQGSSP